VLDLYNIPKLGQGFLIGHRKRGKTNINPLTKGGFTNIACDTCWHMGFWITKFPSYPKCIYHVIKIANSFLLLFTLGNISVPAIKLFICFNLSKDSQLIQMPIAMVVRARPCIPIYSYTHHNDFVHYDATRKLMM